MFPKTHEKNQNTSKILKKLKPKFQKTQKPTTPVELNWRKIVQKKPANTLFFKLKITEKRRK